MKEEEIQNNEEEYVEIDTVECWKKRIRLWSGIAFVLALLVPLIIYDSMGYADYFKLNSGVSLDDDKSIRFVFGLIYFFRKIPTRGFLPAKLFGGLGRLVCGVTQDNGVTVLLSVLFMAAAILAIVTPLICFVISFVSLKKGTEKSRKLDKIFSLAALCVYAFTALMQLIMIATLLARLGLPEFKIEDFLAYGAVKYLIGFVFSLLLGAFSLKLFLELRKD